MLSVQRRICMASPVCKINPKESGNTGRFFGRIKSYAPIEIIRASAARRLWTRQWAEKRFALCNENKNGSLFSDSLFTVLIILSGLFSGFLGAATMGKRGSEPRLGSKPKRAGILNGNRKTDQKNEKSCSAHGLSLQIAKLSVNI